MANYPEIFSCPDCKIPVEAKYDWKAKAARWLCPRCNRYGEVRGELAYRQRRSAEDQLEQSLSLYNIEYIREHPTPWNRRSKFDFFLPQMNLAIEIQGGTWISGKHTRGKGYQDDCKKMRRADQHGLRIWWFTTQEVICGDAMHEILQYLDYRKHKKPLTERIQEDIIEEDEE